MPELPSDWSSKRKRRLKRDNYRCANCSAKGGPHGNAELEVHHIVPRKKEGGHEITNLQTLCKNCHEAIHNKNKKAPTAHGNSSNFEYENLTHRQKIVANSVAAVIVGGFVLMILIGSSGSVDLENSNIVSMWVYTSGLSLVFGGLYIHLTKQEDS